MMNKNRPSTENIVERWHLIHMAVSKESPNPSNFFPFLKFGFEQIPSEVFNSFSLDFSISLDG